MYQYDLRFRYEVLAIIGQSLCIVEINVTGCDGDIPCFWCKSKELYERNGWLYCNHCGNALLAETIKEITGKI